MGSDNRRGLAGGFHPAVTGSGACRSPVGSSEQQGVADPEAAMGALFLAREPLIIGFIARLPRRTASRTNGTFLRIPTMKTTPRIANAQDRQRDDQDDEERDHELQYVSFWEQGRSRVLTSVGMSTHDVAGS